MGKFDEYIDTAKAYLRMPDAEVKPRGDNVVLVIGGIRKMPNDLGVWMPGPDGASLIVTPGCFLYDHVVIFDDKISVRSHEEVSGETVRNIGTENMGCVPFQYLWAERDDSDKLNYEENYFHQAFKSVDDINRVFNRPKGFYHGFRVDREGVAMFYVAKSLKPDFMNEKPFRMPENSYRGVQL